MDFKFVPLFEEMFKWYDMVRFVIIAYMNNVQNPSTQEWKII